MKMKTWVAGAVLLSLTLTVGLFVLQSPADAKPSVDANRADAVAFLDKKDKKQKADKKKSDKKKKGSDKTKKPLTEKEKKKQAEKERKKEEKRKKKLAQNKTGGEKKKDDEKNPLTEEQKRKNQEKKRRKEEKKRLKKSGEKKAPLTKQEITERARRKALSNRSPFYPKFSYSKELKSITLSAVQKGKVDQQIVDAFFDYTLKEFKKAAPDAPADLWKTLNANREVTLDFMLIAVYRDYHPIIVELASLWKNEPRYAKKYLKLTIANAHLMSIIKKTNAKGKETRLGMGGRPYTTYGRTTEELMASFKWYVDNCKRIPTDILSYPHTFLAELMVNGATLPERDYVLKHYTSAAAKAHPQGQEAYLKTMLMKAYTENDTTKQFSKFSFFVNKGGSCGPLAQRAIYKGSILGEMKVWGTGSQHAWAVGANMVKDSKTGKTIMKPAVKNSLHGEKSDHKVKPVLGLYTRNSGVRTGQHSLLSVCDAYNRGAKNWAQIRLAALLMDLYYNNENDFSKVDRLAKHAIATNPDTYQLWETLCSAAGDGKVSIELANAIFQQLKTFDIVQLGKIGNKVKATTKKTNRFKMARAQIYPHSFFCRAYKSQFTAMMNKKNRNGANALAKKFAAYYQDSYNWIDNTGRPVTLYADAYLQMLVAGNQVDDALRVFNEFTLKAFNIPGGKAYGSPEDWVKLSYSKYLTKGFASSSTAGKKSIEMLKVLLKNPDLSKSLKKHFSGLILHGDDDKTIMATVLKLLDNDNPSELELGAAYNKMITTNYGYGKKGLDGNEDAYKKIIQFRMTFEKKMFGDDRNYRKITGYTKMRKKFKTENFELYLMVYGEDKAIAQFHDRLKKDQLDHLGDYEEIAPDMWKLVKKSSEYSPKEKIEFLHLLQEKFKFVVVGQSAYDNDVDLGADFVSAEARYYLEKGEPVEKVIAVFKNYLMNDAETEQQLQTIFRNSFTTKGRKVSSQWRQCAKEMNAFMRWYQKNYHRSRFALGGGTISTASVNKASVMMIDSPITTANPVVISMNGSDVSLSVKPSKKKSLPEHLQNVKYYYTTDGSRPTQKSKTYTKPFTAPSNALIAAMMVDGLGTESLPTYIQTPWSARQWKVIGNTKKGQNVGVLSDGQSSSKWMLGGKNSSEIIIDLGKVQKIQGLQLNLSSKRSPNIDFKISGSQNNKSWKTIRTGGSVFRQYHGAGKKAHKRSKKEKENDIATRKRISLDVAHQVRYLKIKITPSEEIVNLHELKLYGLPITVIRDNPKKEVFLGTGEFSAWFRSRIKNQKQGQLVAVKGTRHNNSVDLLMITSHAMNELSEKEYLQVVQDSYAQWRKIFAKEKTGITSVNITFSDEHGNRIAITENGKAITARGVIR